MQQHTLTSRACISVIGLLLITNALVCAQPGWGHWQQSDHTPSRSTLQIPLLPVIFFDSASADIPERYELEPLPHGSSSGVYRNLHDAYLRVLDVLAEQLLRSKRRITLVGYEDRTDGYGECYLARSRAERVKNYLVHDRGVPSRNIRVIHSNTSCLPPEIVSRKGKGTCDEYRRVEILTSEGDPLQITMSLPRNSTVASGFSSASCIMFDVRSSFVRRAYKEELARFLDSLPHGTPLHVTGYVDSQHGGREEQALSDRRAAEVEKLIVKQRPDCIVRRIANGASLGSVLRLPMINMPELRYLSRVVVVRVAPAPSAEMRRPK